MEEQFITAWLAVREKAAAIGVRLRQLEREKAMQLAHRSLQGHRESEGFGILADKKRLDLSLEALAVDKRFGALFTDEEANNALQRLLHAGHLLGLGIDHHQDVARLEFGTELAADRIADGRSGQ